MVRELGEACTKGSLGLIPPDSHHGNLNIAPVGAQPCQRKSIGPASSGQQIFRGPLDC